MPHDKAPARPAACQRGDHQFADGACLHCDALPPFEGAKWDGGPIRQPWHAPHGYQEDPAVVRGCFGLALFVLVIGGALLAIGAAHGLKPIPQIERLP